MIKKICLVISVLLVNFTAFSQNFDTYFLDKTLRINYLHIGNATEESFKVESFSAGSEWYGTRASLIEPHQYGHILFQVYDEATNALIFSKSYSSLFMEYKTTARAEKETGFFEECVLLPFPKQTIRYTFTSLSQTLEAKELLSGTFNPKTATVIPFKQEYKMVDLYVKGNSKKSLDLLFIPDGYSKKDKKLLKTDMERFASYITNCSPYKDNLDRLNIRYIECYSEESGVSDPNLNIKKNTILNSSYNTIDLDRYLMCLNVWKLHEIADDAPYDIIAIICNSKKYGGGGIYNFYASVNSDDKNSDYVIIHELGHTMVGLADEYYTSEVSVQNFYPETVEPLEPNLTTLVNFESKWKSFVGKNIPIPTPNTAEFAKVTGAFEGGGYVSEGVYRPAQTCSMKDIIYNKFCPVCTYAFFKTFEYYSNEL
ncbi:MAG: IgA Peptidase M64, partial [Bacteroidales bacterium]|nr:IgA Peptidase M64 [Bacteroidales bacterium]